jgi:hypothetical protein
MLACLVAGLGWCLAANSLAERIGNKRGATWLLVAILAVQLGFSLYNHPYYFSYYNPLLGGGQRASQTTIVGVGEGLDIAAQILDEIPGSEDLRVMSWYGIGPFSYYFDGQVEPLYDTTEDVWNINFIQKLQRMDYVVIYTNQKLRGGPTRLFELINATNPRNTVVVNGIEYAWIYRVRDLPFENEIERLQVAPAGEQFGD